MIPRDDVISIIYGQTNYARVSVRNGTLMKKSPWLIQVHRVLTALTPRVISQVRQATGIIDPGITPVSSGITTVTLAIQGASAVTTASTSIIAASIATSSILGSSIPSSTSAESQGDAEVRILSGSWPFLRRF